MATYAQHNENRTYYYERVAIVSDGQKKETNGDGHYLTINSRVVYESDAKGISKRVSNLKYVNANNGYPLYEGSSYLGNNLSYVFNSDYSRLNVKAYDGTIYVYNRKTITNKTSMRGYSENTQEGNGNSAVVDHSTIDNTPYSASTQRQKHACKEKKTCPHCRGTKYVGRYVPSVSEYGVKRPEYYVCNICGKKVAKNGGHAHSSCPECHGTGYVYR